MIYLSKLRAFTLIEMLVVVAIAAILLMIAVPTLERSSQKNTVLGLTKEYLSALSFARSEAVARNKLVSICPSQNAVTCDPVGDWSGGWLVFIDGGAGANFGNGIFDAGEQLLRASEYGGSGIAMVQDPDNSLHPLSSISWNYRGFVQGEGRALVVICGRDNEVRYARGILVERSGRVVQSRDSNNDGIHESRFEGGDAQNLACT